MTLRLILVRHTKSDWGHAGLSDHDRPLNARGKLSAPRIGTWLRQKGIAPDVVLCSTARRTQDTWDGIASHLADGAPSPTLTRRLYEASPRDILAVIGTATAPCVAVIGHNPGIGGLAWSLCDTVPTHPKFGLYPTGATTILGFDAARWSDIRPGTGTVEAFTVPRDLPEADTA